MRRGMREQPLSFQLAPRHRPSSSQHMHCRSLLKVAVSVIVIASMPMLHRRIGRQDEIESRRRGGGAEQKYRQQRASTDRNCHRWRTRRGSSAADRPHYLVLLRLSALLGWLGLSSREWSSSSRRSRGFFGGLNGRSAVFRRAQRTVLGGRSSMNEHLSRIAARATTWLDERWRHAGAMARDHAKFRR